MNLTALQLEGWPDATLDRLFLEPIAAAPLASGLSGRWVDLGSGGGSPAIPLAIAIDTPAELTLTLTESRGRKAAFLREAVRVVEIPGAEVVGRFEDLLAWPERSVHLITCRAVKPQDTVSVVEHLLADGGRVLYFGADALASFGVLKLDHLQSTEPLGVTVSVLGR